MNGELAFSLVAAAECWEHAGVRPISSIEHAIWNLAHGVKSINECFRPNNELIRGLLPCLRFMVERDNIYWQRLREGRIGVAESSGSVEDNDPARVAFHGFSQEKSFAKVYFNKGTVQREREGIECLPVDNWACRFCSRELGNLFVACGTCHLKPLGSSEQECWWCADCFLAHRYTKVHQFAKKSEAGTFYAQPRFFPIKQGPEILERCIQQLQQATPTVPELEETEATVEYLMKHARPFFAKEE